MNKYILFIIILATVLFIGCKNKTPESYSSSLCFDVDTLFTEGSSYLANNFRFRYNTSFIDVKNDVTSFQYILNDSVLFSFQLGKKERELVHLPVSNNLPIYSVLVNQQDTFLLQSKGKLFKKIHGKFEIYDAFSETSKIKKDGLMIAEVLGFKRGMHHINDSLIIIPITTCFNKNNGIYGNGYKKYPLFAKYNVNSKTISYLDYYTPKHYLRASHYIHDMVLSEIKGDTLFISYPYEETIDLFSINKNSLIGTRSFKSYYHNEDIEEISRRELKDTKIKNRYAVENGYYGSFIYNPFNGFYYRIFYHFLPRKNEKGEYTVYSDKSASIAVYNAKFDFLGEHKFEKEYFVFMGIVPDKKGLLIKSYCDNKNNMINIIRLKHLWKK